MKHQTDHAERNHAESNQGLHGQIVMCRQMTEQSMMENSLS